MMRKLLLMVLVAKMASAIVPDSFIEVPSKLSMLYETILDGSDSYSDVFANIQPITVHRPVNVGANQPDTEISCVLGENLSLKEPFCFFEVNGNTLRVDLEENKVTDQFGNNLEGAKAFGDAKICGIFFAKFPSVFLNSEWKCLLQSNEKSYLHRASFATMMGGDYVTNTRLPADNVPTHYDIELVPILDEKLDDLQFLVPGHVDISFEHRTIEHYPELSKMIVLHIDDIIINESTITLDNEPLSFNAVEYDVERSFFIIYLNEPLTTTRTYRIQVDFSAFVHEAVGRGMFRGAIEDSDGNEKWIMSTQMEPIGARRSFPCFDEPALKATFSIKLGRMPSDRAWSNGQLVATVDLLEHTTINSPLLENLKGYQLDIFRETVTMSSYLVAFLIGEMESTEMEGASIPMDIIYEPGLQNLTKLSQEFSPICTNLLEELYGSQYQTEKMDLAAVPSMSWAMENWGLQLYTPIALLWDEEEFNLQDRELVMVVVAHELIHNWVGNSVTLEWWNELWLNEGITSYYDSVVKELLDNSTDSLTYEIKETFQVVMDYEATSKTNALNSPVFNLKYERVFGLIAYVKGSSVVRMMVKLLGEDNYNEAFQKYLDKFAFQSVTTTDYLNALDQAFESAAGPHLDKSFTELMLPFIEQPGFPAVSVTGVKPNNKNSYDVEVKQNHFTLLDEENDYKWNIPIFVSYPSAEQSDFEIDPKQVQWIDKDAEKATIQVSKLPYLLNTQHLGYYRINYDSQNWNALSELLQKSSKPEQAIADAIARATLIDDAFTLYEKDDLNLAIPMKLVQFLAQENNRAVIDSALFRLEKFITVYQTLRKEYAEELKSFEKLLKSIFEPLYSRFSVKKALTELNDRDVNHFLALTTTKSVVETAAKLNIKDALDQCTAALRTETILTVPSDILGAVLQCAFRNEVNISQQQVELVLEMARNEKRPRKKALLMNSLGSLANKSLIPSLMATLTTGDEPLLRVSNDLFYGMKGNHEGSKAAFDWLHDRYADNEVTNEIIAITPPIVMAHANNVVNEKQLDNMKFFVALLVEEDMKDQLIQIVKSGEQELKDKLDILEDIVQLDLP